MIRCPVCSTINMDIATRCENCGSDLRETENPQYIYARQHPSYIKLTILAILIPDVGVILGIVYKCKNTYLDKKLGGHLLVVAILCHIIRLLIYFFLLKTSHMI